MTRTILYIRELKTWKFPLTAGSPATWSSRCVTSTIWMVAFWDQNWIWYMCTCFQSVCTVPCQNSYKYYTCWHCLLSYPSRVVTFYIAHMCNHKHTHVHTSNFQTYFPAFEACVREGRVASIMCSYNAVNGVPSCANDLFQNQVLRDQWGFQGFIVSGCGIQCYCQTGYWTNMCSTHLGTIRPAAVYMCNI